MTEPNGKPRTKYTATKTIYKHGLPFDATLKENLDEQLNLRIKAKFPSLLIIDGQQGEGKTTLLTHIIDYINSIHGLPECDLSIKHHPQLAMGSTEFFKSFNICRSKNLPIIGYDEAGDFSKRGSISRLNALLNRVFETFRSSKIIVILSLPNFNILDSHLFDLGVPRGLLHCHGRMDTITYGNYSGYSLYGMNWIRYWFDKFSKPLRHQCYSKTFPNFRGHFKNLPTDRANKLSSLSDFGKKNQVVRAEIESAGLISYTAISAKLDRSIIWCKKKIAELKIKPVRKIGRKNYFSSETLDRMASHLASIEDNDRRKRTF